MNKKKVAFIYVVLTLLLTWIIQFMPMILKMNISDTSISSFDVSSIFFTIGGMLPSLIGVIFVLVLYKKDRVKDFLKRCFVPSKKALLENKRLV